MKCNTCKGKCSRCGECCTISIPITKEEENTIRKYIIKNNIQPENLYDKNNFYAYCCFYDRKKHRCKIYNVRPGICRSFKCDRDCKELEQEKIENHKKAYWNNIDEKGELHNITTFDLLFYNNPKPLLDLIFRQNMPVDKEKFEKIINDLKKWGQEELANSIIPHYGE